MPRRSNIKVSDEFFEEHNDRRRSLGQTWEEYIAGQAPDVEETVREAVREELARAAEEGLHL